jgi:anti-sigma B factor antagonist
MNKDIDITISQQGDVSIITIRGDVTAANGEAIENAYQDVSSSGTKKILLNFDLECYINSGGIASLIGIVSESRKKEQIIRAIGLSDHFQKIFNMVGLTKYIKIFPSEESALAAF